MAIVISGVNNNDKITAADGTIDLLSGVNYAGIITAPAFTTPGNLTSGHLNVGSNIQLGNAGVATATTFVGNLTGNVNATSNLLLQIGGSEKFRVGSSGQLGIAGANYGTSGQVLTSGGSGSAATWTTVSGTTINSNVNNYVVTATGTANTLQGESSLTYDGSKLQITGSQNSSLNNNILSFDRAGYSYIDQSNDSGQLVFRVTSAYTQALRLDSSGQAHFISNVIIPDAIQHTGDLDTKIRFPGSNQISFETGNAERMKIDNIGHVTINSTSYEALTITTSENGVNGPELSLFHNSASPATSDSIAQIRFNAKDSAGNTDLYARIHANLSSPTSGSESGDLVFATRGSGTFAERLRIDSSGKLGVGDFSSTSVAQALHVRGSQPEIYLEHTGGYDLTLTTNDGAGQNGITVNGGYLSLAYNNKNIVMCRTGGYVGINQTSPQRYLHITGNDGATGATLGNSDTLSVFTREC